ncbi:MAG: TonB-dependent receptor [Melioribacteraceae bacterium]|nr:MAG: TonB-dependent receptor [Melioribacteraceae bacterium]
MKKRTILSCYIYILLFSVALANSQPTGEAEGTVTDNDGEAIIGANVYVKNSLIGAAANEEGVFVIKDIPAGTHEIVISAVGYEKIVRTVEVKSDEVLSFSVKLRPTLLEVGSVVVTGTTTPYLYEDSPVKTEVIPRKLIDQTKAVNLAEALGFQTGVRVENNCQNCNFSQVRILGFDGKYSQVLVDGDPVVNSLAGVYSLEHFPQEMIGQLEIVKGGGSALYGGGAIAGTINIITQKPQLNRTKIHYAGSTINGKLDNEAGAVSELINESGNMGAFIYASFRNRHNYDHNGDDFSELGELNNETIGLNSFYKPFENSSLDFSLYRINEERRGGNDFELPQHEADVAEWVQHRNTGGKVKFTHNFSSQFRLAANYSFFNVNRESYYGGLGDIDENGVIDEIDKTAALDFYGNSESLTHSMGFRANYQLANHRITAGTEYTLDELTDNSVKNSLYHIDHQFTNAGFYVQDDISFLHDHLNFVMGARIDKHSELEDLVFSPRLSMKYEVVEELALRLSYSTGFKAPQIFDEDLHIESLGGDQRVVRSAPNLKEENSYSVSGGFQYEGFIDDYALLFGVTGFYTKLNDAFSSEFKEITGDGLVLWERINSDGAKVTGVDIDFGVKPINQLEVRLGYTFKQGRYDSQQEVLDGEYSDKFLRTPDNFGYMRVLYNITKELNLITSLKYTGSMVVPNESTGKLVETGKSFYEVDVNLSYKLPILKDVGGELSCGVKNLLDSYQEDLGTGADRDPAYLYGPQVPRRIYFGFGVNL